MLDRFYLIVSDADRLERLVPLGVKLVQLRLKDMSEQECRDQIKRAMACCAAHRAQLIVNDYWRLAIDLSADFIHLGQEDLDGADLPAIRRAGLRLGLSTHDRSELARALSLSPDYVALGPIYATRLKKMKWNPQGLEKLRRWRGLVGSIPLVAIGGLTIDRLPGVFDAGADSAAVVTDIQQAADPVAQTKAWMTATR